MLPCSRQGLAPSPNLTYLTYILSTYLLVAGCQTHGTEKPQTAAPVDATPTPALSIKRYFVDIQGGTTMIGDNRSDHHNEKPPRRVDVADFRIWRHEVTVAEYEMCTKTGACDPMENPGCHLFSEDWEFHPRNCASFYQASQFAEWLAAQGVAGARLPSAAEWEFAARGAGKKPRAYPWGRRPATCSFIVMANDTGPGCGTGTSWPVCSHMAGATPEGLCDMSGNLWEWVTKTTTEMDLPIQATLKGGSFLNSNPNNHVGYRAFPQAVDNSNINFGFRIAADAIR